MEKDTLESVEHQCIQGEPAYCTAACPFHLDVKIFLGFMAKKQMDKAFRVIEATLPLPEILARICDHPCEKECLRKDIGGSITIGQLERACAQKRSRQKKHFPPHPKDKQAGIWGSGLSSLVVAWDLAIKGYGVTVFDYTPKFGGLLQQVPDYVLPKQIMDREIKRLKALGVVFSIAPSAEVFAGAPGFDAMFIGY
ncbi:MAG: NAD(P)-binding protein, partial [Desulfobacteraceae bacterium]|nr:NAD(P)-binding protein [Desulfobacteraceae bacterium]